MAIAAISEVTASCLDNPDASRRVGYVVGITFADGRLPGEHSGYVVEFQRRTLPSGGWASLGSLTISPSSYNELWDYSPPRGRRVEYRARSRYQGQTSAWSPASKPVPGWPPTPTGVAARWVDFDGSTYTVRVSYALDVSGDYPLAGVTVEPDDYEGAVTVGGPARSADIERSGPGAFAATLTCRSSDVAVDYQGQVGTARVSVPALRDHGAPSVSVPETASIGSPVAVRWTPNAPSGDAQRRAIVTVDGTATEVEGAATQLDLGELARGRHTVTVATYGITGASSGSTTRSVDVYGPPVAELVDVLGVAGGEVESVGSPAIRVPFLVAFRAADESGVAAATIEVHGPVADDGSAPLVGSYDARAAMDAPEGPLEGSHSVEVGAAGESVPNGRYRATLSVTSGRGLASSAALDFEVAVRPPSIPRYDLTVDEDDLSAAITVHATSVPHTATRPSGTTVAWPGGSAPLPWRTGEVEPASSFDVWRCYDLYGERDVLLASGIADGDTVVDPWPPLNVPYRYRIVARSERGGSSVREGEVRVESHGAGAVNYGPGLASVALCRHDGDFARHREPGVEEVTYKGDVDPRTGKALPHAFPTGGLEDTVDVEFILLGPGYERPGIDAHMDSLLATLVLWRDPFGERWAARVASGDWGDAASDYGSTSASLSLRRISDDDVAYV